MQDDSEVEFRPRGSLDQWNDKEWTQFTDALTWEAFQLARTPDGQPYAKVTLPQRIVPSALILVDAERQMATNYDGLFGELEEEAEEVDHSIRRLVQDNNLPEETEIAIRESSRIRESFEDTGYPEEIHQERIYVHQLGNKQLRTAFKALLRLGLRSAIRNVWIPELRSYNMSVPDNERERWFARQEQFTTMTKLIDGDPEAGNDPRFVILNPQGKPIFGTSPEIMHVEEK